MPQYNYYCSRDPFAYLLIAYVYLLYSISTMPHSTFLGWHQEKESGPVIVNLSTEEECEIERTTKCVIAGCPWRTWPNSYLWPPILCPSSFHSFGYYFFFHKTFSKHPVIHKTDRASGNSEPFIASSLPYKWTSSSPRGIYGVCTWA